MIVVVEFEQHDPAIGGGGIQDHGQAAAGLVRVGGADACPDRAPFRRSFDRISDENGIGGHVKSSVSALRRSVKPVQK